MNKSKLIVPLITLVLSFMKASSNEIDSNGYLVYCPCMGKIQRNVQLFLFFFFHFDSQED